MTGDELIAAGFKTYKPNKQMGDSWSVGYQKRVRDETGTRYFINVHKWERDKVFERELPEGYEVVINFGDGCDFHPRAAVEVHAYSGTSAWSVQDVEQFCEQLWQRLQPHHYEQDA